ncbi:MAG: hypothetical protein R2751_05450 [Bacteroidales bacterium]
MKTTVKSILGLIITVSIMTSCTKNEEILNNEVPATTVQTKKCQNQELVKSFIQLQREFATDLKSSFEIGFDMNEILEVGISGSQHRMIMANQNGFDECNQENYALAAAILEDGLNYPIIVKTSKMPDEIYVIDYYTKDMDLISSTLIDGEAQMIDSYGSALKSTHCGQEVADCLGDVYSKHGWVSVWAMVQTAFIPATAVALTAACVASECF